MNTIQITNPFPQAYLKPKLRIQGLQPLPPLSVAFACPASIKLTTGGQKCLRLMPICASRGEASSGDGDQGPLGKLFGKALENFGKKSSVEDLLRKQIEKGEFYEGDGGKTPPGGSGGFGGGGGGFGESEDEGLSGVLDETIQVVLATLGFIFVYIYIIDGAEITRLAKDYIKFLFGGRKSVRLTRALYQWERFCNMFTEKKETDRFWLEKAIINTPTWWDHPEKYKLLLTSQLQQQMQQRRQQQQQQQQQREEPEEDSESMYYDDE